ncbi:MAG: DUF3127 domain-containing protein [Chitinophagaceae bacterium]|nr:DUF3127 domain-containing protein [Chitinophagaceae bacterium]
MATFETTGTLKVKMDTQVVSEKFSKREFVLTTEGNTNYPQQVSFQLTQDKCSLLDAYNIGDEIKVSFNLRGREWNGPNGIRYFNTLEAWRLERPQGGGQTQAPRQDSYSAPASPSNTSSAAPVEDDMPF